MYDSFEWNNPSDSHSNPSDSRCVFAAKWKILPSFSVVRRLLAPLLTILVAKRLL